MRLPIYSLFKFIGCGLVICCTAVGCTSGTPGPTLHPVSGQVVLDGEAIATGSITFIPLAGTSGPSAGSGLQNGVYSVPRDKGLAEGNYRVEIRSVRKTGRQVPAQSPSPVGTMTDEIEEAVPVTYNANSTLEVKIPAPENKLDFKLTTPK